jgi:hypothetical protein
MSYILFENLIFKSSLIFGTIGATIGTGFGIKFARNLKFPNIGDIFIYPFFGLLIGTAVGIFLGVLPPLIPIYSYLIYHHRETLFPKIF